MKKAVGIRGSWKFDPDTGGLVEIKTKPKKVVDAPYVWSDEIEPTLSMTGSDKVYTSKSSLRREYKEMGFVERGDQPADKPRRKSKEERRKEIRADAAEALRKLKWNEIPMSELEKQKAIDEERKWKQYQRHNRQN